MIRKNNNKKVSKASLFSRVEGKFLLWKSQNVVNWNVKKVFIDPILDCVKKRMEKVFPEAFHGVRHEREGKEKIIISPYLCLCAWEKEKIVKIAP